MQNLHAIKVRFIGPSNTKGARVKLTSDRFDENKTISYDYGKNSIAEMAAEYLQEQGHQLAGKAEAKEGFVILSATFKSIK